jgi:indole-3-glycerol phosphate synthase
MIQPRTASILETILARTDEDLRQRRGNVPVGLLESRAREQPTPINLQQRLDGPEMSVVAEIKRASPSRGRFPTDVDPAKVAAEYIRGGASAISVLTDKPFFQGSLDDLESAVSVAHEPVAATPVLRKDFIIDPYQILEARAHGADAILLIVAALDDVALRNLLEVAQQQGMSALVEVHDEEEMARASAVGATVIGINNRDLRTFVVDLAVTERLAPLAPEHAVIVAESGIFTRDDVRRLRDAGASAVLVGESLITATDRAAAVRSLLP